MIDDPEHVRAALAKAEARFMKLPNVRAVDYGIPRQGEDQALAPDRRAIRVHVDRRLDEPTLAAATRARLTARFPTDIDGIPVDVVELPPLHQRFMRFAAVRRGVVRDPILGGIGIGPSSRLFAGTLGAIVQDRQSKQPMLLSNYHVLYEGYATPIDDVIQPSRLEGGSHDDVIAYATRHAMGSTLDAAVATLTGSRQYVAMQRALGALRGVRSVDVGEVVQKCGFGSNVTRGLVTSTTLIQDLRGLDGRTRRFRDVVFIESPDPYRELSRPGDSGSLWLDVDMNAVALHFAGSNNPEKACAADLPSVLDVLDVELTVPPP
jgi:hypothetical protein